MCYNNVSSNLALDIQLEQNAGSFYLCGVYVYFVDVES